MIQGEPTSLSDGSPPWNRTTKLVVALAGLFMAILIAWRFQSLIGQIIVAAMLAYIMNPAINLIDQHTPFRRGIGILLTYLLLAAAVIGAAVALGVAAYTQTVTFITGLPDLIDQLIGFVERLIQQPEPIFIIGPLEFRLASLDWEAIRAQVLGLAEPLFSRGSSFVRQFAQTTLYMVGYLLFVFVLSIYIAIEIPRLGGYVASAAHQPGYRRDAERLMAEFKRVWSAYLRGQVILGLVIGVVVWLGLTLLGVQNSLALGILSGLLEFVPLVGPLIGAGAAVIVAFFQPDNYLGLDSTQLALAVLVLMIVIQQIENNVLVPRIVGEALDLHPLLVMIGVFMGASIAGILGAILAAPIVASLKLLSLYAWRKMFDLPPFPLVDADDDASQPLSWRDRARLLLDRWRRSRSG